MLNLLRCPVRRRHAVSPLAAHFANVVAALTYKAMPMRYTLELIRRLARSLNEKDACDGWHCRCFIAGGVSSVVDY